MKHLHEIALSAPVSAWLEAQGYTVYSEVPLGYGYRMADLVGKRGQEYCAVELKAAFNWKLFCQGRHLQMATAQAWVAVGTVPQLRSIEICRKQGLGLLSVQGQAVTVLLEPRDTGQTFRTFTEALDQRLAHMSPGGQAGRPTLKGEGPAQDVARRVAAYRKSRPGADWKEIFAKVSNHYANAKSMRYSLVKRGLA